MGFNQEFTINPVGQGLFYSGIIRHNNITKFRMVFDCGSVTKGACEEEVTLYRDPDFINNNTLDLLVISHFDRDHVSHIGALLAGGIKVKRLVMPFITFSERLFLVARYLDSINTKNPNDPFITNFIIDPLGTIIDNLDGDSEIYLVDNDPDNPIPLNKTDENQLKEDFNGNERYTFEFSNSSKVVCADLETPFTAGKFKMYKIKDSNVGKLKVGNIYRIMNFGFYKRSIGKDEEDFYESVKQLFFDKYSIDKSLSEKEILENTVNAVKTISSATVIKDIFRKAKTKTVSNPIRGLNLIDMNSTALCMLHRNLDELYEYLGYSKKEFLEGYPFHSNRSVTHFRKFKGSRIETENDYNEFYHWYYDHPTKESKFIFPNTLLTSDTFLLNNEQVNEFLNHYQNYWNDFWLFQIPHHGSDRSSDGILHSCIPKHSKPFINYGINNNDDHPSISVINSLVVTGNSSKLIPVNELCGLKFSFQL